MKRRDFIQSATSSVLLPSALTPCAAAPATLAGSWDCSFFDERFAAAHRLAASWRAADRLIPVQSDITPLWSTGLDRMTREHSLALRGVTTESFHFCLRILAGEHAHCRAKVARLDRNLFLWTMSTTPRQLPVGQSHV
jgi:hypothetical protein